MSMTGPQGPGVSTEKVSKGRDARMGEFEVKIASPQFIQGLVGRKDDIDVLQHNLESTEFPGYRVGTQADIETLKVQNEEKQKRLTELSEGYGNDFNLVTFNNGKIERTRYVRNGSSFEERPLKEEDKEYPHLRPNDCLFLIKKTNA